LIGDNTTNAYEITFDRATRKITKLKRTEEAVEPEEAKAKPAAKKPAGTKATPKKKDGEEDDEDEEEKTVPAGKEKEEE
jgi:hypothetical protein